MSNPHQAIKQRLDNLKANLFDGLDPETHKEFEELLEFSRESLKKELDHVLLGVTCDEERKTKTMLHLLRGMTRLEKLMDEIGMQGVMGMSFAFAGIALTEKILSFYDEA